MTEPLTYEQIVEAMRDAIRTGRFHAEPSDQIARAALSAQRALCDELGYRLAVPCEATEGMSDAGWIDKEDVTSAEIYRAMLAAAPDPTKEPE